ncbi:MAG: BTAD domain-containing putative transcriptional regulator, partial [Candidatus Promineifilaceae bacterium]
QVLGKLRLWHGETIIDRFPTRRVEELLAFLLSNQQREHTREQLIEILWPEFTLSNGRASLSTALWRMNTVFRSMGLPPDRYVNSSRDWISLTPTHPFKIDSVEFETFVDQAEQEQEREKRLVLLGQAVRVYKGVFCEGIYSEWCLIERERLERRYLWARGVLMADEINRGAYEKAILHGEAIIDADPLREEVHRALMLCYWKMGNSARAMRQFQICANLLQEELGIYPLPETISLYGEIVESRLGAAVDLSDQSAYGQQIQKAYRSFQSAASQLEKLLSPEN